jgi:hypothetical protein
MNFIILAAFEMLSGTFYIAVRPQAVWLLIILWLINDDLENIQKGTVVV